MKETIRKPAVSGWFYDSDPDLLKKTIQGYLDRAVVETAESRLMALIVPHAGLYYSGLVAAHAYKLLYHSRHRHPVRKCILLGPAHRIWLQDMVTDTHDLWETPLGSVRTIHDGFSSRDDVHREEHSLEMQVPFLQIIFDQVEILPLVIGDIADYQKFVDKIDHCLDEDTVLIASSDLSHYHPYSKAIELDNRTIEAIRSLDPENFKYRGLACGEKAILIVMELAKRLGWSCKLLSYMNSGDISGDKSSVVGYASIAFYGQDPIQ